MEDIIIKSNTPIEFTEEEKKFKMTNTEPFKLLVIEPNEIKDRDWTNIDYLYNLVNDKFCHYLSVHPDDYIEFMSKHLKIEEYTEPYIKVQIIFEEKDYITEMMYVEVRKENQDKYKINEFANLLNIGQDKIYGNIIINRSYVSSTNNDMHLDNITPEKMLNSLHKRVNTTAILYDSDYECYKEVEVFGPIDIFANNYFESKKYNIKKIELAFLKHNINIWYTEDEYGITDVCGKLIPENTKVDKMIVFSMWTVDYRDSLYLDEFNKIIKLSKKIDDYNTPPELVKEEKDHLGREILKNKYKILNLMCEKIKL